MCRSRRERDVAAGGERGVQQKLSEMSQQELSEVSQQELSEVSQ